MKRIFTILILMVLFSFATAAGIEEVIAAMKTGNAAQVAKSFDATVEISTPGKSSNYNKTQAEQVLKDFFAANGVKGFDVIHKGDNAGAQYCIGTLVTKNGNFRTTIYLKPKGDLQLLQELHFEGQ